MHRITPLLGLLAAVSGVDLPAQWITNPATGSQYLLLQPTTWHAAQSAAQALGAHLVVVDDAAENQWLVNNMLFLSCYIGGTDASTEGTWTTPSGAPLGYTNWAPSQPDNHLGNEDYLVMWGAGPGFPAGVWNDATGQTLHYAIIERDGPLLQDEFTAATLDPTRWLTVTQGISGGQAAVTVQNGECLLQNRGYLCSIQQFDAQTEGAYKVELDWRATDAHDSLRVLVRSDGVPTGNYSEAANGIGVGIWLDGVPTAGTFSTGSHIATQAWVTTGPGLTPVANTTYHGIIVDYGYKIVVRIEDPSSSAHWVEHTTTILTDTTSTKRLVIYNREWPTQGAHTTHIDNVSVTRLSPIAAYVPFGNGCPDSSGTTPSLLPPPGQAPRIGTTSKLRVAGLPLSPTVPVFVMGFSNTLASGPGGSYPLPIDLAVLGWPGCSQLVSVDDSHYAITNAGFVDHSFTIPAQPFFAGLTFHCQALVLYTGGAVAVSNGITATAGW